MMKFTGNFWSRILRAPKTTCTFVYGGFLAGEPWRILHLISWFCYYYCFINVFIFRNLPRSIVK